MPEERNPAIQDQPRWNLRALLFFSLGHFSTDAYAGFVAPLFPALMAKLGLSLTDIGILVAINTLAYSLPQLLFGYLSDRVAYRLFILAGPILSSLMYSAVGLAGSFSMLALLLILGSLGVAAFHPSGAMAAGASSGSRRAFGYSIFLLCGSSGYAVGPLVAVGFVGAFGLGDLFWAALPGLAFAVVFGRALFRGRVPVAHGARPPLRSSIFATFGGVWPLFLIEFLRATVYIGFFNFLPILFRDRGQSLFAGGAAVALLVLASGLGGVLASRAAEKVGQRIVAVVPFLLLTPLLYGVAGQTGWPQLLLILLAGLLIMANNPLTMTTAQLRSPRNESTASALLIGVAWGCGGILNGFMGRLADSIGVEATLHLVAFFSLPAALVGLAAFRKPLAPGRGRPRIAPV